MKKFVILVLFMLSLFFVSCPFFVKPVYASGVSITLASSPASGLGFVTLNGVVVTTPYTFSAQVGDLETIAAVSPANTVAGQSRYVWTSWSDSGAQSHTITLGSSSVTYTANFQLQYYLNVSGGYSATGQGWYNNGASVTVSSNWLQSIQGNTSGLVGLWHFDEDSGTTAYDSSGIQNNSGVNGASWVAGQYGDAVSFNGLGAYVEIPNSVSLNPNTITVDAWVNLSPGIPAYDSIVMSKNYPNFTLGFEDSATPRAQVIMTRTGEAMIAFTGVNTVPLNTWVNVAYVYDGRYFSIYLNGVLDKTRDFGSYNTVWWTNDSILIGRNSWGGTSSSRGTIDDLHIYNRALSPSEISSLFSSRMAVTKWQLDGVNQNSTRINSGALITSSIIMNTYHTVAFTSTIQHVVFGHLNVTDYLGIPISGAKVTYTLANETTIQSITGSDGTLSLGLIPIGPFRATISYLGTTTEVNGNASIQAGITGKIFASYPTFSVIGGVATIVAVGSVLVHIYRRSPPFQAKIKEYFRVNWGAPFIMGFMLLFVVAAVSLSLSLSSFADEVAFYASFALVVGFVLQLIRFWKYRKKDGESD